MNILPAVVSYDSYLQGDMDFKLVGRKTCWNVKKGALDWNFFFFRK